MNFVDKVCGTLVTGIFCQYGIKIPERLLWTFALPVRYCPQYNLCFYIIRRGFEIIC